MVRKDTDRLISFKFFSLNEFYDTVEKKIGCTLVSRMHTKLSIDNIELAYFGARHKEILARKFCWPEGVHTLSELSSLEKIITKSWSKKWCDDDGDEMDVERFYNDMPFLQKRVKAIGVRSRNNTVQKIVINLAESSDVTAKEMLWKTYAATKLVDNLESLGTRCEVIVKSYSGNVDSKRRYCLTEIPIKNPEDPINVSLLCTTLSPWFFRYWILNLRACFIEGCLPSLGNSAKLPAEDPGCIIIDNGACLSKDQANNFLKGITHAK